MRTLLSIFLVAGACVLSASAMAQSAQTTHPSVRIAAATARTAAASGSAAATPPLTTAQVQADPLSLFKQFSANDLQAALADAQANNDTVAAACWQALLNILNTQLGALSAPQGVFSTVQKGRDLKQLILNMQSQNGALSTLNTACAPVVLDAQNTLVMLGIAGGIVAGKVALPIAIPGLPPLP